MQPVVFREGISVELRNMMELCLTVNPKQRIEMSEIAKTTYMSRLIYELETKTKDLSTTCHTRNQSLLAPHGCEQFTFQARTYEDGLALLQYCRLIHKASEEAP